VPDHFLQLLLLGQHWESKERTAGQMLLQLLVLVLLLVLHHLRR
jgi:hypothetical protein